MKGCMSCHGSGLVECPRCKLKGKDHDGEKCRKCNGAGMIKCLPCDGTGRGGS